MLSSPPVWQGHYRYCEAMFLLGEHKRAMAANEWAQTLCKADPEGMKDLLQQHAKFNIEMEESKWLREEESKGNRETLPQSLCLHTEDPSDQPECSCLVNFGPF